MGAGCALASCFKDEPMNAECDIEVAWVHTDAPADVFFSMTDTIITVPSESSNIVFSVRKTADLTALAPQFQLTEGAVVEPASGSVHDFSDGKQVQYTVTSEDGAWSRTYNVSFVPPSVTLKYDFENYRLDDSYNGKFYVWKEIDNDGSMLDIWATGNSGFWIANSSAAPDEYPTAPLVPGYDGAGVRLVTRSTGTWGETMNKRIAAGNLFLGTFDMSKVIMASMESTCFGIRFNREPQRFKGYYKYQPGETYQDRAGNAVTARRDSAAIYSVLYRNHDAAGNEVMLHGDDVMTNPNIVAIARLWDVKYADEWTEFSVDFVYSEPVDNDLLENYDYNIAVVFSSSKEGAYFEGAVGSTLCIDKVSLECLE